MQIIGANFLADLTAAGLHGLPLVWTKDGITSDRNLLSETQNAALDAVIAAHVPAVEDSAEVAAARVELSQLYSSYIPSGVADLLIAGALSPSGLSAENQANLARIVELRAIIQESSNA